MKKYLLLVSLALPLAAQESFQLETETSGCFLPSKKRVVRWELHGENYTSSSSPVVLRAEQVGRFRQELLALPLDNGPSDWDQFDPEIRREAYRKLTHDYGLRPDLKDLAEGLGARPSSRLWKEMGLLGGTEWKLSFSGASLLKLKTSGANGPVPLLSLEDSSRKWDAFSYEALDFLRILEGKAPGAELEFYLVGDEGRWKALLELQNQPRFTDWEKLFRIEQADLATIPKYALDLAPRRPSIVDAIWWRGEELDCELCLSTYQECLAQLQGRGWLKQWKSSSANRSLQLRLEYGLDADGREWQTAGLPGRKSHELVLRGPDNQWARLLIGQETELCLVVSSNPTRSSGPHWLDNLKLSSGQAATVTNDGTVTKIQLGQP